MFYDETSQQRSTLRSFSIVQGQASPLGAQPSSQGCNFAVEAGAAKHVELCLFDEQEKEIARLVLPGKQGTIRFGFVEGIKPGQRYAYRVFGEYKPEAGLCYDPRKLLIDPYSKSLTRPLIWDDKLYDGDSAAMVPKSIVVADDFDWQGVVKPSTPREQSIVYEVHVRGFSQLNHKVPKQLRGTYLGLSHPASIDHLKALGVSAVQLLPVATFMSEPRLKGLGLSNYWGYNPIAFMAPEPRYARKDAREEFKTMVRELHRNGIEVILDVVFNHTAESGGDGPTLSLRGFDNRHYYLYDSVADTPNYQNYANNTGCGNSVSMDHRCGFNLVIDTLRYWYQEMQVDGFRFDLAVSVGREHNHYRQDAAFFRAIEQDPVLSEAKLIAEPWDIGPNGYQLGHFPERWLECSDRYRDNIRSFWRGDDGQLAEFATRLMGSRDLFQAHRRSIHTSVNYICYHDGFTLHDLVSYEQRHNAANGEDNRDGHGHNLSANYGEEGETNTKTVNVLRRRQKRNLLATLMLSQGVPHFLGGDELGRTQQGNNNAYCQNNPLSWFSWELDKHQKNFLEYSRYVIELRKSSGLFSHLHLENDIYEASQYHLDTVRWHRPDGKHMHQQDWHEGERKVVALELQRIRHVPERWYWMINASDKKCHFNLPKIAGAGRWKMRLDTSLEKQSKLESIDEACKSLRLAAHSMVLVELVSK